jgi:hypothetical protein
LPAFDGIRVATRRSKTETNARIDPRRVLSKNSSSSVRRAARVDDARQTKM